jgi:ankyrin repeat protein
LGYTPLHVAAHYGQVEMARILLEAGAVPDQEDLQV